MIRKILITFLPVLLIAQLGSGKNDTLRYYDPASANFDYNTTSWPFQVMRLDLPAPALVREIIITLDGPEGGSAKMHFYGHEGGTSFPQLRNDLVDPVVLHKDKDGSEQISVKLSRPVFLTNNQFFIAVEEFSKDVSWVTDSKNYPVKCESGNGGKYYYQFFYNPENPQGQQWTIPPQNSAFAVDVVLEYPQRTSPGYLKDVTADAGIDPGLSNKTIAVADLDEDGYLDLVVNGKLYYNNGDSTFSDSTSFAGLTGRPKLNAFVDMNNDGYLDIAFFGKSSKPARVEFYVNDGSGIFKLKTIDSLKPFIRPSSISIADVNGDQYPDVFISQLWDQYPDPLPNYLFYNDQKFGFQNKSKLLYPAFLPDRRSRGSEWVDFDNDGDQDLYVTNYYLEPDEVWENMGDGSFRDIRKDKGIDQNSPGSNHGTGVDWADYDNDGDMDLLLPQFAHPRFMKPYDHRGTTIYRNEGPPGFEFTDLIGKHGLQFEETHAGGTWGDVNNDGLLDIVMTTYYGCRYMDLYTQHIDHTFRMKTFEYGLKDIVTGEDAIWADFNNDGKPDLFSGNKNRFRLYMNTESNGYHFVEVELRSTSGNSRAIGSRVKLYAGNKVFTRQLTSGRGQRMQGPHRLHFGLKWIDRIDSMTVLWPGNPRKKEVIKNLTPHNIYLIEEGKGIVDKYPVNLDPQTAPVGLAKKKPGIQQVRTFPNPFPEVVHFEVKTKKAGKVRIRLFDREGKLIRSLSDEHQKRGKHTFRWRARNSNGSTVPPGIYFYHVNTPDGAYYGKVVFKGNR